MPSSNRTAMLTVTCACTILGSAALVVGQSEFESLNTSTGLVIEVIDAAKNPVNGVQITVTGINSQYKTLIMPDGTAFVAANVGPTKLTLEHPSIGHHELSVNLVQIPLNELLIGIDRGVARLLEAPEGARYQQQASSGEGGCNISTCCFDNGTAGCDDPECEAIVCAIDSFCCDIEWDAVCVGAAEDLCGDLCTFEPPANDDCENAAPVACQSDTVGCTIGAMGDPTYFCGTSQTAPGVWYSVIGTGTEMTASTCNQADFDTKLTIWTGACEDVTDCCFDNGTPGCEDPECEAIVCGEWDPFCCDVEWDGICAGLAAEFCGDLCSGGNLVCVDGNDDSPGCGGFTSEISWDSVLGAEYFILVHGYEGNTGNFILSLDCDLPVAASCTVDLVADGGPNSVPVIIGTVTTTFDEDSGDWTITYQTTGSWMIAEAHLHVACDPDEFPQTGNGNPRIGQFDYVTEGGPLTQTVTHTVADPDCCIDGATFFAAHAAVVDTGDCWDSNGDGFNDECREESAWGAGTGFGGNTWATYFDCDCVPAP